MRHRYQAGDWWECDGLRVHIEKGNKSPNDIRVTWDAPRGRYAVSMESIFRIIDALFEAEDIAKERPRYQHLRNFKGWKKFRDALKVCYERGPDVAAAELNAEKDQAQLSWIEVDENGVA